MILDCVNGLLFLSRLKWVAAFSKQEGYELVFFARRPEAVTNWLTSVDLQGRHSVKDFAAFNTVQTVMEVGGAHSTD